MARGPTIQQLAEAAGVSVATVDRVVNARLPVRPETAARVQAAATRIGFHASGLIGQRIRSELPEVRLGFLLLKTGQQFYGEFARELEVAAAGAGEARVSIVVDHVSSQAPAEVVQKVEALATRAAALAIVAPDHPSLTALVERLKQRGIPVFSLLSDFAVEARHAYVGLHNGKAGRTAAWMISRCAKRPGKVALFVGSHRFQGHESREMGFRAFFREEAPEFTILDTMVNLETRQLTHDAVLSLADKHSDLVAVYVAGGGMEGAISALRMLPADRRPAAVCSEITPESRAALAENILTMVIATPIKVLSRELVGLMVQALRPTEAAGPAQIILPFDIYLPASV